MICFNKKAVSIPHIFSTSYDGFWMSLFSGQRNTSGFRIAQMGVPRTKFYHARACWENIPKVPIYTQSVGHLVPKATFWNAHGWSPQKTVKIHTLQIDSSMILMSSHLARAKSPWLHLKQTPAQTNRMECQGAKNSRREPVLNWSLWFQKDWAKNRSFIIFMLVRSCDHEPCIKMNVKQRGSRSLQEIWMDGPIEPTWPSKLPKLPFASWRSWGSSCWISSSTNRESDWEKCRVQVWPA